MTARVSMLLKSRASLTCFRGRFVPGRAKDPGILTRNVLSPYMLEYIAFELNEFRYVACP